MSSTLPKLKIKFPKRSTPSNDPKADEGKGRPSKKRKSVPEHYTDKQSVQKPADDLPGRQSQAERDLYGEANKVRTQVQASTRPREGNEGLQTKPEPQAKPRLVIKGKFAKAESLETHPTNKEELPDGQNFKQAHDLLPQKKKKKKKKHKDQIGDPDAPNGLKLPSKVKLRSQQSADGDQGIGESRQHFKKEQDSQQVQTKGFTLPAKPSQLRPAPTDSQEWQHPLQAPSTMTGLSDGGHAVNSMPSERVPSQSTMANQGTGQEASSAAASKPDLLPGPGDVERLLNRLQKKDPYQIFKEPVTDAVAPGYSAIIKRPMSFAQMRAKIGEGQYPSWSSVQTDIETMFNNAMIFNAPATPYHKQAREMMGVAKKLLQLVKTTGQLDARGRKPGGSSKPSLAAAAASLPALGERRTERRLAGPKPERPSKPKVDKKKAAQRKAAQRAAASGILAKPQYEDGRGDLGPLSAEENMRATFWPLLGTVVEQQWKGLGKGSSASGVSFGSGRPTLRANFSGSLSLEAYVRSVKSFGSKLRGKAKEYLDARCQAASKVSQQPVNAVSSVQPQPALAQQQTWMLPGPASSAASTWGMLPKSRPLAASQNADHPQTDAPKIAGPGIAGPASLYTGTQALSAANPTQMATGIPSSQTMSPIGWSLPSKALPKPSSSSGLAGMSTRIDQHGGTLGQMLSSTGQQQNNRQAHTGANQIGQTGGSMARQEQNNSHSTFNRPLPATVGYSKPPVEWQPLQNTGVNKDWLRQHQPQPGTR